MSEPDSDIEAAIRAVRDCEAQVALHAAMLADMEAEGWDTAGVRRALAIKRLELELARMRLDEIYRQ
jgi:hypothetical protein